MKDILVVLILLGTAGLCRGQCYGSGDIAASVLVPLILATIITAAIVIYLWRARKIVFCPRRGKPVKAAEGNGSTGHRLHGDQGEAYTNPGFLDDTPVDVAVEEGHGGFADGSDRSKTTKDKPQKKAGRQGSPQSKQTSPHKFELPVNKLNRMVSTTSLDDTYLNRNPEVVSVNLQSQDFIGLGFNIQGSMRDGIRVSQVHNRGPAIESGKITAGDRIQSVTISFENMVYEDALTILSYASPYPVKITLQKNGQMVPDRRSASDLNMQLNHPIYRSQSLDALTGVGKDPAFKKKRNFSEMKSSPSHSHTKVHSVQLSSCNESQNKTSDDLTKWRDVTMPDFKDGQYSDDDGKVFEKAEKLFAEAKKKAERRGDASENVNMGTADVTNGEISINTTADKTDSSFFDVTKGDGSLTESGFPSDSLEDITLSLNDTPVKEDAERLEFINTQEPFDFDSIFRKMGEMNKSSDSETARPDFDQKVNIDTESKGIVLSSDDSVKVYDVKLDLEEQETKIANSISSHFTDDEMKKFVGAESKKLLDPFGEKGEMNEEDIVPYAKSARLNAALNQEDHQSSVEEDEIVPESKRKTFDIDSQIEFESVGEESFKTVEERDFDDVKSKLALNMLRDSSSVEASMATSVPSDDEPVVEENLEAVLVRRDSENDKIFGASLRDSRPLFRDEVVVDEVETAQSVTQEFALPKHSVTSHRASSSGEEDYSEEEGEYRIQGQEVNHDLSAEDIKGFRNIMSDRAYRLEASSGDVLRELTRGVSDENMDISVKPITRAVSYDMVVGADDSESTPTVEGRSGSFKSERKGHVESSLDWSGKRLVRSGSFSEIPQLEDKDEEDRDWTFNNNVGDEIERELKRYKQLHDLSFSKERDYEDETFQVIRTKISAPSGLGDLSGGSDSSSRSSPVAANGGDINPNTSSNTTHFVSRSYNVTTVQSSSSDTGANVGLGKYSFTVRTGSDGEESDSVA